MSEDLGVAFGVVVADHSCRHLGATTPVNVVDVDVALSEGLRWFELNGARLTVADRQPDYLLVFADPHNQRQFTYKTLECKGSVSRANVRRQLARTVKQLGSLEVGGRSPQGIAVGTVNDHIGVHYFAVDPHDPAGGATDGRDGDVVEINDDDLERARRPSGGIRTPRGTVEIAATELVARSLFATAGGLADYAGNYDAAAAFLPSPLWERLARNRRERSTRETADGVFRGLEYQLLRTGRLSVVGVHGGC